jgi:predicted O-methyltransferase YrrM
MSTVQSTISTVPAPAAMLQLIAGFWVSRAVYIAAKLGLSDLLKNGPKSVQELASSTGTHAPSLYRVLRALAGSGVYLEQEDGRFATTPLGATLESGAPGSLRALAITELGEEHYPAWEKVLESVRTGEIAFDKAFGMPVWEFFAQHPENAATFNDAMSGVTGMVIAAVLQVYDFSKYRKIVDIGGGHGGFLAAMLQANPQARGVVFDQPEVIEGARAFLRARGLENRCEIVAGSFFESVPSGGDLYTLKWIIHDWDEQKAVAILRTVGRAMTRQSTLLLAESILAPANVFDFGKLIDLNMLVMTGGRERTEAEYRELLAQAGFRMTRAILTDSPAGLIEAVLD